MGNKVTEKLRRAALLAGFAALLSGCGRLEKNGDFQMEISQREMKTERQKGREEKIVPETEEPQEEETTEAPEGTEEDSPGAAIVNEEDYAYLTLEEEEKKVYGEVLTAILEHRESIEVSTLDKEVLEKVYKAVFADYGGLYWVSGYIYTLHTRNGELTSMEFSPKYTMDYEERKRIQQQIDASVEELLAGISITDSDYEKAKYVFEVLVQNVDYDVSAENSQNIISAFLNRATVCQGYACATQYLLRLLGIQSVIVTGNANGESHAWNLVRLNGRYYYMDTTWGNSRYLSNSSEMEKYVNYNYLAITTEEISRTHTIDNSFALPECTSMEDNYFIRENRYFSEWNPEAVGAVLTEVWNAGGGDASVKFASKGLYERALDYFIAQQYIADYCENISSIYYLEDEELYVLTFHFF